MSSEFLLSLHFFFFNKATEVLLKRVFCHIWIRWW